MKIIKQGNGTVSEEATLDRSIQVKRRLATDGSKQPGRLSCSQKGRMEVAAMGHLKSWDEKMEPRSIDRWHFYETYRSFPDFSLMERGCG